MFGRREFGHRGFAFVELLIVITLLGIAVVAAVAVGHARRRSSHAGQRCPAGRGRLLFN